MTLDEIEAMNAKTAEMSRQTRRLLVGTVILVSVALVLSLVALGITLARSFGLL